jgi:hypothetical protein
VAPVLQVIVAIHKANCGTALTGVSDLEAAQEVNNMKSIHWQLEPTI